MDKVSIKGIVLTDLKIIKNEIKGWKKHLKMTMNIIVPVGEVTFVLIDDRENSNSVNNLFSVTLSPSNYYRLTVPPGIWHAFKGHNHDLNMVLNVANMIHQPDEIIRANIDDIHFEWGSI
jgi:dTDP-4-dehydrorhamnose 3,5-epimerase